MFQVCWESPVVVLPARVSLLLEAAVNPEDLSEAPVAVEKNKLQLIKENVCVFESSIKILPELFNFHRNSSNLLFFFVDQKKKLIRSCFQEEYHYRRDQEEQHRRQRRTQNRVRSES